MLFNSLEFLVFFPIVILLYFATNYRWRWLVLLLASYFFYGSWKVEFISLIALSTLVDFWIGKRIAAQTDDKKRWRLLQLSLLCNLGILGLFKYGAYLSEIALYPIPISEWRKGQIIDLITFELPAGISFYTFQTLAYTIDIYKKRIQPEKHLGKFALYVSFFPQLLAGPIERFGHLQPQLLSNHKFTYENLQRGFRLMLYGFFIKMVIADNIAPLVDAIYQSPMSYSLSTKWLGIVGFSWQIYADFYGYSLIAIGAARVMGVELMTNFRTPYFAISIKEFWGRWHISLSTWFRDYVFVPLGGSKVNRLIWIRNIMVVFVVSGFWHGANHTFLIWGAIHGVAYVLEATIKIPFLFNIKFFGWLKTYGLFALALIFFRAENLKNAMEVPFGVDHSTKIETLELPTELIVGFIIFILLELLFRTSKFELLDKVPFVIRWAGYALMLFMILAFAGTTNHPFIYFQF